MKTFAEMVKERMKEWNTSKCLPREIQLLEERIKRELYAEYAAQNAVAVAKLIEGTAGIYEERTFDHERDWDAKETLLVRIDGGKQ